MRPASTPSATVRGPSAALTGSISKAEPLLIISYGLTNNGSTPIYVWDQMINYNDKGEVIDPDLAYVFWEEPKTVRIVRAVLALPPDRDVFKKEIPYVRKILPGAKAEGRIMLPVPVKEYSPFYSPATDVREVRCDKVRLLIGWTEELEGMVLKPLVVGGKQVLALRGAWKGPVQKLAELQLAAPVALSVRQDTFDRSMPMQ